MNLFFFNKFSFFIIGGLINSFFIKIFFETEVLSFTFCTFWALNFFFEFFFGGKLIFFFFLGTLLIYSLFSAFFFDILFFSWVIKFFLGFFAFLFILHFFEWISFIEWLLDFFFFNKDFWKMIELINPSIFLSPLIINKIIKIICKNVVKQK